MNITITCEQCQIQESYITAHANTNKRRFCTLCANSRKHTRIKAFDKVGRPLLRGNKSYGAIDMDFTWDSSYACGGLI